MPNLPSMLAPAMLLLILPGCSRHRDDPDAPPASETLARAVTVSSITTRTLGGSFQASGVLMPFEEAAVTSQVSGYRVAKVLVDEGAMVRAGQPLALLDPTLIEARIAQARAQLAQSQAVAAQNQGEAGRVRGLEGSGVVADEQIATRRFKAASSAAAADVSRAQLQDLLTQRAQLVIRAPVSGVVLQRNVQPGALAAAGGDPMFRIARDRLIEMDAEIPEDALSSVQPGTPTQVYLPSGEHFTGTVRLVSPRIDPQTKLGRARVRLPISAQLRSGGFARAQFERAGRGVPAVPETAVQYEASGPVLIQIDASHHAHRRAVRTGAHAGGWVELIQGPPLGTQVALGGGTFLADGDLVRPVNPATGK